MTRPISLSPLLATMLALGSFGCSAAPEEDQSLAAVASAETRERRGLEEAMATAPDDCLLMVWSNQQERDIEFDRAHDLVDGGAISCATGTSPSQFQAAIEALRAAARSGDSRRVLAEVGIPLLYIDRAGQSVELDEARAAALADEVFDAELMRTLERLDLADMTVVPERGGFFELGSLWLVVDQEGGRPRLVTVNRQALAEAADAARSAAQDRQGELVPGG
ncbi:MAG: hypothetical protein KKE69_12280 [Alphaproteobacteria bacterium]|nr:hypothetical protein [Alphaproteobacteria bacterium]